MSTNLDKIMWLNRRVPVGTHGGVRGRLFRVERASYSIIYNHPSTFPIVCMWDKPAFSFLIKTVLISLQSNPEKNSHRLLVANLWLVKHPFFVSAILPSCSCICNSGHGQKRVLWNGGFKSCYRFLEYFHECSQIVNANFSFFIYNRIIE